MRRILFLITLLSFTCWSGEIFNLNFETGDLSQIDGSVVGTNAALSASDDTASAHTKYSFKIETGDGGAGNESYAYKNIDTITASTFRLRFYLNYKADTLLDNEDLLVRLVSDSSVDCWAAMDCDYLSGSDCFAIGKCGWNRDDNGVYRVTGRTCVGGGEHIVEARWDKATSADANDGKCSLWVDNVLLAYLNDIDIYDRWNVHNFLFGNLYRPNANDSMYWDEIVLRDDGDSIGGADYGNRYWVSTEATEQNWSNAAYWSNFNGGLGGASVPDSTKNVYFTSTAEGSVNVDQNVDVASIFFNQYAGGASFNAVSVDVGAHHGTGDITFARSAGDGVIHFNTSTWDIYGDFDAATAKVGYLGDESGTVNMNCHGCTLECSDASLPSVVVKDSTIIGTTSETIITWEDNNKLQVEDTLSTPNAGSYIQLLNQGLLYVKSGGLLTGAGNIQMIGGNFAEQSGTVDIAYLLAKGNDTLSAGTYSFSNRFKATEGKTVFGAGTTTFDCFFQVVSEAASTPEIHNEVYDPNIVFKQQVDINQSNVTWTKGAGFIKMTGTGSGSRNQDLGNHTFEEIIIDDAGGTKVFTDSATFDSLYILNGTWDPYNMSFTTVGGFRIGTGGDVSSANLDACSIAVGGDFTVAGSAGDSLDLLASATWNLNVDGTGTADFVTVAYSDASHGSSITPTDSRDGGNNVNWGFCTTVYDTTYRDTTYDSTCLSLDTLQIFYNDTLQVDSICGPDTTLNWDKIFRDSISVDTLPAAIDTVVVDCDSIQLTISACASGDTTDRDTFYVQPSVFDTTYRDTAITTTTCLSLDTLQQWYGDTLQVDSIRCTDTTLNYVHDLRDSIYADTTPATLDTIELDSVVVDTPTYASDTTLYYDTSATDTSIIYTVSLDTLFIITWCKAYARECTVETDTTHIRWRSDSVQLTISSCASGDTTAKDTFDFRYSFTDTTFAKDTSCTGFSWDSTACAADTVLTHPAMRGYLNRGQGYMTPRNKPWLGRKP